MDDFGGLTELDQAVADDGRAPMVRTGTDSPLVRVVPVGIVHRGAGAQKSAYLRLTLVILPEREEGLADWPTYVAGLLATRPVNIWIGDGSNGDLAQAAAGAKAFPAITLHDTDAGTSTAKSRLWAELLFPKVRQHHNTQLGLVMASATRTKATERGATPWARRLLEARLRTPLAPFRMQPPTTGRPAIQSTPESEAISTVSAGLGQLDQVLMAASDLDHARGLRGVADRLARQARQGGATAIQAKSMADALRKVIPDHVPATETLLGTSDLFRFTAGAERQPGPPLVASSPDDERREHAKLVIGAHGLAVAKALAKESWNPNKGFSRDLSPGPIEDRVSSKLSNAIDTVWAVSADNAKRTRNPAARITSANGTPADWTATVTQMLRDASRPGTLATARVTDKVAAANLLARYVLAHRPEPQFAAGSGLDQDGISAITRHVMLRSLEDVETRRVVALLAYPAVARVLRLVVDVEIPLNAPELEDLIGSGTGSGKSFWAAATFGGTAADARLWTPCRLDGESCVALSRGEVTAPAERSSPHWRGLANFAEQMGGAARYTLTSRHVTAAVEQLIHKSRGTDTATRSGGSAAGRADATSRTVGIMLIDNGREVSVHGEIAAADAQRQSLGTGQATPIFLEDLSVGYRVDACVSARDRAGSPPVWRSLMYRDIRFGAVRDPRGKIEVETLVALTLRACATPGRDGSPDAAAFRRALDEASVRPATRQVRSTDGNTPGSEIDLGQLVPQESVFQWHGDPLGLTCGTERVSAQTGETNSGTPDTRSDLALPVTFGPSPERTQRPPRLEFKRDYRFRARHAMLGGVGIGPGEADRITASADDAVSTVTHTHLRHERVTAPHVAMLSSTRRGDPGENIATMVIRSADTRGSGDVSRRIVWAPGVPMGDAAAHPNPARPGERILDKKPRAGRRPLGGLINVMLDPATGGLPVDRGRGPATPPPTDTHEDKGGEGLFVVHSTSAADLRKRTAHYYPDPAVDALMVEIEPASAASPLKSLRVPIYDPAYRQEVDEELDPAGWRRCEYPCAMPILIETISGHDPAIGVGIVEPGFGDNPGEVGTLDGKGDFTRLGRGRTPPRGTVTVRRVRILLPAGCQAKLHVWGVVPTERRGWFSGYASAHANLRRSLSEHVAPAVAFQGLDALLEEAPMPHLAEIAEVSLVHAVQRPDAPSFPADGLQLKRLNYSTHEWVESSGSPPVETDQRDWAKRHLGTAAAWVDGDLTLDGPDTSEIALSVVWRQADDVPGRPIPTDAAGFPNFPLSAPKIVTVPVEPPSVPQRRVTIDLLTNGARARGITLPLPDSRAYQLQIRPTAKSGFIRYFADGALEDRFTAGGDLRFIWALSTRRPDSMGALEILPVFIWEEIGRDTLVRTMIVRLSWRRSRPGRQAGASLHDTRQLWYSSGWEEKLAMVFDRGQPLGPVGRYSTQWGADPIRDSHSRPAWETPLASFATTPGSVRVDDQWIPYPGTSDDAEFPPDKDAFAASVDLLTIDPRYDPSQDAWYADVRIDAPTMANMWIRLGLARYQEHALDDRVDARRDLHVSRPSAVQFELKPKRTVAVLPLPRDPVSRKWPVRIEVRGPLGSVNGLPRGDDGSALEPSAQSLGTFFTIEVRRHRVPLLGFGDDFNETIHRTITDAGTTPHGDLLCSVTVELDDKPWGEPHSVLITERDRMLSANEDAGLLIEESGPTFMAELKIRRPRGKV